MITIHLHRVDPDADNTYRRGTPIAPRTWLCGAINGQATGDSQHVDCEECLKILEAESARVSANQKTKDALSMPPQGMPKG